MRLVNLTTRKLRSEINFQIFILLIFIINEALVITYNEFINNILETRGRFASEEGILIYKNNLEI